MEDDDPGWPIREALFGLLPGAAIFLRRRWRNNAANGLVVTRQLFLSFCLALFWFGVVLFFIWPSQSKQPRSPGLAIGLLCLGLVAGIVGPRIEKPLDCTDEHTLAGSYRTRFFLRLALSEVAALLGFVGFFIASEWWVYPLGVAIAAVGFARAAPTRRNLQRDQEVLNQQGCPRSLVAVLAGTTAG